MAQQRSSEYIAATMNGAQSVLEGIFNPAVAYDDIRMRIMRPLNNEDANNMRLTSSRMDYGVTVPLAGAGRRELRFQRDQLDECDEDWLPMPPALPLQGTCPNTPQSDDRIFPCRSSRYRDLRGLAPHGPTEHLVCSGCRDNGHHNILPVGLTSLHDQLRHTIAWSQIRVCNLCDREQRAQHPQGSDGCTCYRDRYQRRWLCWRCHSQDRVNMWAKTNHLHQHPRAVRQRYSWMEIQDGRLPRSPWCPCGRGPRQAPPVPPNFFQVWQGHPQDPNALPYTRQCLLCCGYIVPTTTARRSARVQARVVASGKATVYTRR